MPDDIQYDDNFSACAYTHVWLSVISEHLNPDQVTRLLRVEPTSVIWKGTIDLGGMRRPHRHSGWFLSTEGIIESQDARRHLDWILDQTEGRGEIFRQLAAEGHESDICCRWDVATVGGGGPSLQPRHFTRLAALGVELWFDIYVATDD